MPITPELLDQLLKDYKSPEDMFGDDGLLQQLTKAVVERALQGELTHHLGYEKHDPAGANWVMLWHGRNLIIFNNIVRNTAPGDRVLVVYGAGHGNLLRQYAGESVFYTVEDTVRWMGEAPVE